MTLPREVQAVYDAFAFPCALAIIPADGPAVLAGARGRVFDWMSVTKLVTARVVLAAVEDGQIDLDDTVGDAGTVEELLAHASGLDPKGARVAAPRTRRIYSNAGYERLAAHVEAVSGRPWNAQADAWLARVGATNARCVGSAAWGASSDIEALAALARELLAPRLIDPALDRLATRVAWPGLPGILPGYGEQADNCWGLGPEIAGDKHPHWTPPQAGPDVFGHFGQSGSFLWVDRDHGLAACFLGARPFGRIHQRRWPQLGAAIIDAYA